MALDRKVGVTLAVHGEGDENLLKEQAQALGDMEEAAKRVEQPFAAVHESIQKGFRGTNQLIATSRAALDEYRGTVERVRQTGGAVTEEHLARIAELEDEYKAVVGAAGEFRTAQQQAKRDIDDATEAAGGQAERINSLNDVIRKITEDLGPGAVKWVSWGLAAVGALKAGWEAGQKFREVMNDLTDNDFDRWIQKVTGYTRGMEAWEGVHQSAAEKADLLRNQINILEKNGFDTAKMSAEEMAAEVEKLGKAMQAQSIEAANSAEAHRKWLEELGLSKTKLDEQAKALAENIARFVEANKQLKPEQFAELFEGQIQRVLDAYARLGEEPPKDIKKLADEWGVTATKVEAAIKAMVATTETELKKLDPAIQAIIDKFDMLPETTEKAMEAMRKALNLTVEDMAGLEAARQEAAERTAQELNDNAERAVAVVEQINKRFEETFANDPNVKWLDALMEQLRKTKELADETAAAVDRVAVGGPLGAPEGGWDRILRSDNRVAGQ